MKNINKPISVLIPDGESHLLIYVVNSLYQTRNVKIYVMSSTKYIPGRYSRFIHHFSYYPKSDNEFDLISNINLEIEENKIDLVMPIFEDSIAIILKYRESIPESKLCLLSSINDFEIARNKWLLAKHSFENGIPFPKSILYSSKDFYQIEQFRFPVIIKPIMQSTGGDGVCLFKNKDELYDYVSNNIFEQEQIIQDYIEGYDIDCSVLCKSGNILAYTIQKGTMLSPNPFEPPLGAELLYEEKLFKTIEKLMSSLNYSGVAHIDLRFDSAGNNFKVIEINTRFWGSLDASTIAGVNFPYLYCLASMNKDFDIPQYKHLTFLSIKGLVLSFLNKKPKGFKYILNNTPIKYAVIDPMPIIFKYLRIVRNLFVIKLKSIFQ